MATTVWLTSPKTELPGGSTPTNQSAALSANQPKPIIAPEMASAYSGLWRLANSALSDCNPKSDYALLVRIGADGKGSLNGEALETANPLPEGGIEIGQAFLRIGNGNLLVRAARGVAEMPSVYVRCAK